MRTIIKRKQIEAEEVLALIEKVIEAQHKGKYVSFYLNNEEISVFAEPKKIFQRRRTIV